jgi:hypothetical protein
MSEASFTALPGVLGETGSVPNLSASFGRSRNPKFGILEPEFQPESAQTAKIPGRLLETMT